MFLAYATNLEIFPFNFLRFQYLFVTFETVFVQRFGNIIFVYLVKISASNVRTSIAYIIKMYLISYTFVLDIVIQQLSLASHLHQ